MLVFLSVKFTFYDPSIRQCLFTLHPGGQTKHVQLSVKVIKIDKWLILDPSTSFKRVCLLSLSPHKKALIYLLIAKKNGSGKCWYTRERRKLILASLEGGDCTCSHVSSSIETTSSRCTNSHY